jgi:hypothetical protein
MIRLVGEDGEELAVAAASVSNRIEAMAIVLEQIERGAGNLLRYYFARGQRIVVVHVDGLMLPGTLRTRWTGTRRTWTIELVAATSAAA